MATFTGPKAALAVARSVLRDVSFIVAIGGDVSKIQSDIDEAIERADRELGDV